MPRRARLVLTDVPIHIVQRGNDRRACFFASEDYLVYLDLLRTSSAAKGCDVHAYVLMTNHVHLLLSPHHVKAASAMMKALGERYVRYINRRHERSGTLWEGRYRSCLVQDERYLLVCQRYIELNPVRAGMVADPLQYPWSSYRANAYGEPNPLVTAHASYSALASSQDQREAAYRHLFGEQLSGGVLDQLRHATNGNYVFGTDEFALDMTAALGRSAAFGGKGRPRIK